MSTSNRKIVPSPYKRRGSSENNDNKFQVIKKKRVPTRVYWKYCITSNTRFVVVWTRKQDGNSGFLKPVFDAATDASNVEFHDNYDVLIPKATVRESHDNNQADLETSTYPRPCIVLRVPSQIHDDRNQIIRYVESMVLPTFEALIKNKSKYNETYVTEDANVTPAVIPPLDHKITDKSVQQALLIVEFPNINIADHTDDDGNFVFPTEQGATWYAANQQTAGLFFSRHTDGFYSQTALESGYPNEAPQK